MIILMMTMLLIIIMMMLTDIIVTDFGSSRSVQVMNKAKNEIVGVVWL